MAEKVPDIPYQERRGLWLSILGALFMATDMVASPMTSLGCVLYGVLIGVLVVVIRLWGGMPEGVMYAILIGNAFTLPAFFLGPTICRCFRPRRFMFILPCHLCSPGR